MPFWIKTVTCNTIVTIHSVKLTYCHLIFCEVPVLSEQITVVEPSVSTAFMRRMIFVPSHVTHSQCKCDNENNWQSFRDNRNKDCNGDNELFDSNFYQWICPSVSKNEFYRNKKYCNDKAMKPKNRPNDSSFNSRGVFGVLHRKYRWQYVRVVCSYLFRRRPLLHDLLPGLSPCTSYYGDQREVYFYPSS